MKLFRILVSSSLFDDRAGRADAETTQGRDGAVAGLVVVVRLAHGQCTFSAGRVETGSE